MLIIHSRNVNDALNKAWTRMYDIIDTMDPDQTRFGKAYEYPTPVTTVYERPYERVLFTPARQANPFFHFMEGLWMLNGDSDVEFPCIFAKSMSQFSDDGQEFHAAYGARWFENVRILAEAPDPDRSQLERVIQHLLKKPHSRRAVLQMWDYQQDLEMIDDGKDVPCNMVIHFMQRLGNLEMTVHCRSNDILWGCYGANAVHMSMLQEYVAARLGLPIGRYYQVSDSWHVYPDNPRFDDLLTAPPSPHDNLYLEDDVSWAPLFLDQNDVQLFQMDLPAFIHGIRLTVREGYAMADYVGGYAERFDSFAISEIAVPMWNAWRAHKMGNYHDAHNYALMIKSSDWAHACDVWLSNRKGSYKYNGDRNAEA